MGVESACKHFQPGEGPSRGLLRDCTNSPINRLQHYLNYPAVRLPSAPVLPSRRGGRCQQRGAEMKLIIISPVVNEVSKCRELS